MNFDIVAFLKRLFKHTKKLEPHMQHFSEENLDKMIADHKLKSAALARLKGPEFANIARTHGHDQVNGAINNLSVERIMLEAQIDVLREFLEG